MPRYLPPKDFGHMKTDLGEHEFVDGIATDNLDGSIGDAFSQKIQSLFDETEGDFDPKKYRDYTPCMSFEPAHIIKEGAVKNAETDGYNEEEDFDPVPNMRDTFDQLMQKISKDTIPRFYRGEFQFDFQQIMVWNPDYRRWVLDYRFAEGLTKPGSFFPGQEMGLLSVDCASGILHAFYQFAEAYNEINHKGGDGQDRALGDNGVDEHDDREIMASHKTGKRDKAHTKGGKNIRGDVARAKGNRKYGFNRVFKSSRDDAGAFLEHVSLADGFDPDQNPDQSGETIDEMAPEDSVLEQGTEAEAEEGEGEGEAEGEELGEGEELEDGEEEGDGDGDG